MRRLGVLVTAVLLTSAASAFADDTSKGEVSGGWRYYHATIASSVSLTGANPANDFPKGWYGDVAGNLSPKFAIVGEVGGFYRSDDKTTTIGSTTTAESSDITLHTFMGGIRVRAPQNPKIIPFGQVLFGGEHNSASYDRTFTISIPGNSIPPSKITRDETASGAALALDGGMTVAFGSIGVRMSGGYVRMFGDADADAFRFSLGGAYRF
jgi:hypothetical protein